VYFAKWFPWQYLPKYPCAVEIGAPVQKKQNLWKLFVHALLRLSTQNIIHFWCSMQQTFITTFKHQCRVSHRLQWCVVEVSSFLFASFWLSWQFFTVAVNKKNKMVLYHAVHYVNLPFCHHNISLLGIITLYLLNGQTY